MGAVAVVGVGLVDIALGQMRIKLNGSIANASFFSTYFWCSKSATCAAYRLRMFVRSVPGLYDFRKLAYLSWYLF